MKIYEGIDRVKVKEYHPPCIIQTQEDKEYFDLNSGAGAFFFGYPKMDFSDVVITTNIFNHVIIDETIEALEKASGYRCPILLCSGSEGNEAAIKLALKATRFSKPKIGYMPGCYFGRTFFSVMCSDKKYNEYLNFNSGNFVPINSVKDDLSKVDTKKVSDGGTIDVWGDGSAVRSYTYVDDMVDGICRLMQSDLQGPTNIGNPEYISVDELVTTVAKVAGKKIKINNVKGPVGVESRNFSNQKIFRTGWKANFSTDDGIRLTYPWIESHVKAQIKNPTTYSA